jgi:hypothetical protein
MNGLPPHIAQIICGHNSLDTTIGYKKPRELHQMVEKSQVGCSVRRVSTSQRSMSLAA